MIRVAGPRAASARDSATRAPPRRASARYSGRYRSEHEKGQRVGRRRAPAEPSRVQRHRPIAEQAATDQLGDRLRGEATGRSPAQVLGLQLLDDLVGQVQRLVGRDDAGVGALTSKIMA